MADQSFGPRVTSDQLAAANRREYDRGIDPLLRLAVYEPAHSGWLFTNIGGATALDYMAERAGLDSRHRVLELCSGLGDTCRYLVRRFGCDVTGIELNVEQLRAARERLAAHPKEAARIELRAGDVRKLDGLRQFDAVIALDSLMMISSVLEVARQAWQALRPGGWLVAVEMTAGPHISPAARQYAWEEGAIVCLPTPQEYTALFREAGFVAVESVDMSAVAQSFFDTVRTAVREQRSAFLEAGGPDAHAHWDEVSATYHGYFKEAAFTYTGIAGRRPA